MDQPRARASAHCAVLLVSLTIFGHCTAVAVVEFTAQAAITLVLVPAEEKCTALAHVGQSLPVFPVLRRVPLNRLVRHHFRSVHGANSVWW